MIQKPLMFFAGLSPLLQSTLQYQNVTIYSGGKERWYLITFPPNFESRTSVPVILSFHGGGENATEQLGLSQMSNPEFNDFAISVYPQGVKDTWEGVPGVTTNDTQFTSDIIDQLEGNYPIDESRIWATGKSDGGGFCNVLACDPVLSTRIAAFAPVSGAFYVKNDTACHPKTIDIPCNPGSKHIPILEFHGGHDKVIRYEGAGRKKECLPSIPHWVREWAERDDLSERNQTSELTNDTLVYIYGTGKEKGLVTHVFDESIGHDWPSTVPNDDNTKPGHSVASFNATPIIIEFFKKHALSS